MPIAYYERRFSASSVKHLRMPYRCACCGFATKVEVVAHGGASVSSPFGTQDDHARDGARIDAEFAATERAKRLVERATCPKCERRDPAILTAFQRRRALMLLLAFGLPTTLGALLAWATSAVWPMIAGPTFGVLFTSLALGASSDPFAGVDDAVLFGPTAPE